MNGGLRFSGVPVWSICPREGVIVSAARYGITPVLEFRARHAVGAGVPPRFAAALFRSRYERMPAGIGAHSVRVSAVFDSVRVAAACHLRDTEAFLGCWPRLMMSSLTTAELEAAASQFTAETAAVAADEQSRLFATLYQRAGWGHSARVGLAEDPGPLTGVPLAGLLGRCHAYTAVTPDGFRLSADLLAQVAYEQPANEAPRLLPRLTDQAGPDAVASVSLGWAGPAWHEPDFPAFYIAGRTLGGTHNSILMRILRAERGWSYSPWAAVHLRPGGALLELQARVGHERVASARTAILESLAVLRDVPEEDLRAAAAASEGQLRIGASSQAGLAGTINHYEFLGFRLAGLDDLFTAIAGLTPVDVADVSDRHLCPPDVIDGN